MASDCQKPLRAQHGFSVVEVLVAFVVLTLSMTALYEVYAAGFRNTSIAEHQTVALRHAKSVLATVGVTKRLEVGQSSGTFSNGIGWKLVVSLHKAGANVSMPETTQLQAYRVTVTINTGLRSAAPGRTVSLSTIKIGASHK